MAEKKRYQVIGCDGPDGMNVHHLADFDTLEDAEAYRKSAELMSWQRTAVHDRDSDEIISPKPAPGRKREDVNQAAARIIREATERD